MKATNNVAIHTLDMWLSSVSRELLTIFGGAVCMTLLSWVAVPLPFSPVPISCQTLAVMLLGATLGSVRGMLAVVLHLAVGFLGFPVTSTASLGLSAGPTSGYLVGFIVATYLTGWLIENNSAFFRRPIFAMLIGNCIIYVLGVPVLAMFVGLQNAFIVGLLPFVVGDAIKIFAASSLYKFCRYCKIGR